MDSSFLKSSILQFRYYKELGEKTIEQIGEEIFEKIIAVASGEKSKSEINGYGDDEFNPWIIDPTL